MFTKRKFFKPFLGLFLALSLIFPLAGCDSLPPELGSTVEELVEEASRDLPGFFQRLALAMDELVNALFPPEGAPAPEVPEGSTFAVHYIDVGQADCALVACDGHYMLIDGGNAADSDLVYSYLKSHDVEEIDYLVATHAHEDHIGGLSAAPYAATIGTALSPVTEHSTKVFQNLVKSLAQQDKELTVPAVGDTFTLGSAQVEVLGPTKDYDDPNDTSIILSVTYGETDFLFTGDMESGAEADLIESGADLSADVLKVGHHGSDTSSSYRFLREVMPTYAVISVGEGNSYGHPSETVLSRLSDAGAEVYRTDLQGTVIAYSDGTNITFETEK